MAMNKNEIQAERKRLRDEFGSLFESIAEILFRHDPVGINFEHNTDEYEPEVGTIIPRLKHCHSVEDVTAVIHEEFQRWFDLDTAGSREDYTKVAEEVWMLLQKP